MTEHTFDDCDKDNVLPGSVEATRRYIAKYWPHGGESELSDTYDAALLAHAYAKRRAGSNSSKELPGLEIVTVMDRVEGDYWKIREWADRYRDTGCLWAGEIVEDSSTAAARPKNRKRKVA